MTSLSDSNCCSEPVSYAVVERTALVALSWRFFVTWIRLVLILYFLMVAHKAACRTLSNAFMKSTKTW